MIYDNYDESELKTIPIKNLAVAEGLDRRPWVFTRGAKVSREYLNAEGEPEIRVVYDYEWIADEDGKHRRINGYNQRVDFLDSKGSVFQSNEVPNSLNVKNIKEINRAIRQGRMDYLESGAEQLREGAAQLKALAENTDGEAKVQYLTLAGQYDFIANSIDLLFNHYRTQVTDYISRGTMDFETDVNNETDAAIIQILNLPARQPDDLFPKGLTVKQSIMFQLTGVKP